MQQGVWLSLDFFCSCSTDVQKLACPCSARSDTLDAKMHSNTIEIKLLHIPLRRRSLLPEDRG
jgi:hypothetical protein